MPIIENVCAREIMDSRGNPTVEVDVLLDEHFDNARMERIYPNAKKVEKAG